MTKHVVMTKERKKKLEAMARAWCEFNGWVPDHRPLELVRKVSIGQDSCEYPYFDTEPGPPRWERHMEAMNHILMAIEDQ